MNCHTLNITKKNPNSLIDVTAVVWNSWENTDWSMEMSAEKKQPQCVNLIQIQQCFVSKQRITVNTWLQPVRPYFSRCWSLTMWRRENKSHGQTRSLSVVTSTRVVKQERAERCVFKSLFLMLSRKKYLIPSPKFYTKRSYSLYNSWKIVQQQTLSLVTICTAGKL